ncbi:MAG: hypothetical protein P1R74_03495, partial [Sedimenticola sp.]|nr:hypothetical protein [Sedimenticola sp.]
MAIQVEAMQTELAEQQLQTSTAAITTDDCGFSREQQYRAGAYSVLASLLGVPPDQARLDWVSGFAAVDQKGDAMALAMSMLGLAAKSCRPETIEDEYHALFIG